MSLLNVTNLSATLERPRKFIPAIVAAVTLTFAFSLSGIDVDKTINIAPQKKQTIVKLSSASSNLQTNMIHEAHKQPIIQEVQQVAKPKVSTEQQFVTNIKHRFNSVSISNLKDIYYEAKTNGVDPKFSAAIAWKETKFRTHSTSGCGARGEYQVMASTAISYGISNPQALYDPKVGANVGNKYLKTLFNMFDGKDPGTGYVFFKTVKVGNVDGVTFKGHLLHDQNGQVIPVSLLVAMAYNGGPTTVYNAAKYAATYNQPVIIDPRSKYCPFSYQQLDYVRKIKASKLFNFQGYHFSYAVDNVPQNELV